MDQKRSDEVVDRTMDDKERGSDIPNARPAVDPLDIPLRDLDPDLGRYAREARQAAGLTIERAGEGCGRNYAFIARFERGESLPDLTPRFLLQLARMYGKTRDEIFAAAGVQLLPVRRSGLSRDVEVQLRFRRIVEQAQPIGLRSSAMMGFSAWHKKVAVDLLLEVERRTLANPAGADIRDAMAEGLASWRTPAEVNQLKESSVSVMSWVGDPGFGKYLRRKRKALGLSLHAAGERYGASHAMIAKLEGRTWQRPPTPKVLRRLADAYEMKLSDLMEKAGFRSGVPPDVLLGIDIHDLFEKLVVDHLQLVPGLLSERELDHWSAAQKQQLYDMAEWVDGRVRDEGQAVLAGILSSDPVAADSP